MQKLIKINTDHYIIVDDSEIREGDFVYDSKDKVIRFVKQYLKDNWIKKITHSTQPLGFLNEYGSTADLKCDWTNVKFLPISEVKELIGEVDVEKKAKKFIGCEYEDIEDNIDQIGYDSFIRGYTQALEDNKDKKYTEEDFKRAFFNGGDMKEIEEFNYFIKSLQPKTEWEVEFIDGKLKLK